MLVSETVGERRHRPWSNANHASDLHIGKGCSSRPCSQRRADPAGKIASVAVGTARSEEIFPVLAFRRVAAAGEESGEEHHGDEGNTHHTSMPTRSSYVGIWTENSVPIPGVLRTTMVPPMASTIPRTMVSPSPLPSGRMGR